MHPYISFSLRCYVGNTGYCEPIQVAKEELWGCDFLGSSQTFSEGGQVKIPVRYKSVSGQFGSGHS